MGVRLSVEKIKNLSLRKSIILYLFIALTCSFFTSAMIVGNAERDQEIVWAKYTDIDEGFIEQYGMYTYNIPRPGYYEMSDGDRSISERCDFLITWTPLILSTICSAIAVLLFYRDKLEKPLQILEESSNKIAESRLDFQVEYPLKDEMGRLCTSFEHMRRGLEVNNKYLWKTIEEQKNLKAAITHDIRAPLAVLKGYHEMLLEFIPQDKLTKEKLIDMIEASHGQVERLGVFVDRIKQLSSLEERKPEYELVMTIDIKKKVQDITKILAGGRNLDFSIIVDPSIPEKFMADQSIILEVFDNILSNAIRYASKQVNIFIEVVGNHLQMIVSDDGSGFQEENINLVTNAFYHNNPSDDLSHFGLGLYISKLLCECHGGMLLIANRGEGGASVKAVFEIKNKNK